MKSMIIINVSQILIFLLFFLNVFSYLPSLLVKITWITITILGFVLGAKEIILYKGNDTMFFLSVFTVIISFCLTFLFYLMMLASM